MAPESSQTPAGDIFAKVSDRASLYEVSARDGLQNLPAVVVQLFNRALEDGRLATAGDMLGNLGDLAPGDPSQDQLRNRLATAWLDRAEQQLDTGDRQGAAQSLERVRKLAPQHPRLPELTARLNSEP